MNYSSRVQDNVYEFIKTLSPDKITKLYSHPPTCLAVFRSLPEMAKIYTMRLLYIDTQKKPIPVGFIKMWHHSNAEEAHEESLAKMKELKICNIENDSLILHPAFRKYFKYALTGGGSKTAEAKIYHFGKMDTSTKEKHQVTIQDLEEFAKSRWEAILHYIANIRSEQLPEGVITLLLRSGLMQKKEDGSNTITEKGFQFLLQDVNTQIWAFLLQYVEMAERELQMDIVEVLNFLFQLGSLTFGRAYSTEPLTLTQQTLLMDLWDFGIVYRRKQKDPRFYPTRLATSLTSSHFAGQTSENEGYIIVETNFRVYAYTDSPLQLAILNFFVEPLYRFQNMSVGVIRRDKIVRALTKGIKAQQIITFLKTNAHPQTKKMQPTVPTTVSDQIMLWQMERDRLQNEPGILYTNFESNAEFHQLKKIAEDHGALLYANPAQNCMIVIAASEDELVRKLLQQLQSQAI